jgi:peptidoglycan-N-acetylglucosamine deacetylase
MPHRKFVMVAPLTVLFLAAIASASAHLSTAAIRAPAATAAAVPSFGASTALPTLRAAPAAAQGHSDGASTVLPTLRVAPAATQGHSTDSTKTVYLTFDDGPNPIWTLQILSLLEDTGAHASFFVIGENAKAWPELVEREVRDGDTVGDHTWSHPNLTHLSAGAVFAELARDENLIARVTGKAPTLWRPPYGAVNQSVIGLASGLGMQMQLWSVSTGDWQLPGTRVIVSRVMSALHNGMVVLFHDGGGYTRSETVAAVAILIPEIQAAGYRVAALPAQGMGG